MFPIQKQVKARVHPLRCKGASMAMQGCTEVSARMHRGLCKVASRSLQGCTEVSARSQVKACEVTERAFWGQNDPFSPQTGQISPGGGVFGCFAFARHGGPSVLASRAGKDGRPQGPARGDTRPTGLVQEFGRAFQGKLSTDNSPAFQGWVKSQLKFISPVRGKRTFAPSHQLLRNLLVEDFLNGQSMPLSLTGTSLGMPPRAMPAQFSNAP